MNWNYLTGMGLVYDSNLKNKYFTFILNFYLLTASQNRLNYSFERNHIEAEFKVSNLLVVYGMSMHSCFTHIVLRAEQ